MRSTTALALLALCVLWGCSDETNPYLDPAKSGISVVAYDAVGGDTLQHGDTVQIFSADTVFVLLMLQAHVDSFVFEAHDNRLWMPGDTVVRHAAFGDKYVFPFVVSYYETGLDTIRARAFLSNGDVLADSLIVTRASPLNQQQVQAQAGDLVELSTTPVADDFVLYVWKVGQDSVVNDQPNTVTQFASPMFAQGELYVKLGGVRSPSQQFQVVVRDNLPPTMTVLNDSVSADGAHVYTGNVAFRLEVRFSDPSSDTIGAALFASTYPDWDYFDECVSVGGGIWDCAEQFYWLPTDGDSLWVVVFATDPDSNYLLDTLWVHYDSTLITTPTIRIDEPAVDFEVVASRSLYLRGVVEDFTGDDTLHLFAGVNEAGDSAYQAITRSNTNWQMYLELDDTDSNLVSFVLVDAIAEGIYEYVHVAYRWVLYDSSATDSLPPDFLMVSYNGARLDSGDVLPASPVELVVSTYDPSGVSSVTINGGPTSPAGEAGVFAGTVELVHTTAGNTVTIEAVDAFGNRASTTRFVYLNIPPEITGVPQAPVVPAGGTLVDSVVVSDADGDAVAVTLLIHAPGGDTVVVAGPGGVFAWTPDADDVGDADAVAQVTDGYPGRTDRPFTVVVKEPDDTATVQAHFVVTAGDFPDTLVALQDTLQVVLSIDVPADSGDYFFSVRRWSGNISDDLMDNSRDSVLVWAPGDADVGVWNLEATVQSAPGLVDTLDPAPVLTVLPAPEPLTVAFGAPGSQVNEGAGAASIPVLLSRTPEQTVTVTYAVNSSSSEADSGVDYTLPPELSLTFTSADSVAVVPVSILEDTTIEGSEKLTLFLKKVEPLGAATISGPSSHALVIVDNDTSTTIDTLGFTTRDSIGDEGDYTISVRIGLHQPASRDISAHLRTAGSAQKGLDYKLGVGQFVIPAGAVEYLIPVTIIDDDECERLPERIQLTLETSAPQVVVLDDFYQYTIRASLENCSPYVAFVYGGNQPDAFELRVIDTIAGLGLDVHPVSQDAAQSVFGVFDAVVVSGSADSPMLGQALRGLDRPVLCASLANAVTMGLTALADTGRHSGSTVELDFTEIGFIGKHPITQSISLIPWATPADSAAIKAYVPGTYGGAGGSGAVIWRHEPGSIGNQIYFPPDRRTVFPVCVADDASGAGGTVAYTDIWWALLKHSVLWLLEPGGVIVPPPLIGSMSNQ